MYALVEIQGRQYRVSAGAQITVERMANAGETVELNNVLLVSNDGEVQIGQPYVAGAKVTATLEGHTKGRKLVIYKFRRRKNYRRKQGHRQPLTRLRIDAIEVA